GGGCRRLRLCTRRKREGRDEGGRDSHHRYEKHVCPLWVNGAEGGQPKIRPPNSYFSDKKDVNPQISSTLRSTKIDRKSKRANPSQLHHGVGVPPGLA